MKIEKSLGGDFMRLLEGQEGAGLSGHCEVTAKSEEPHVFRKVPIFQTSGNVVQGREQRLVMKTPSESDH